MIPEENVQSNVDRFSGFENIYDKHRPEAPDKVVELVTTYLQRNPELVVDLGCGTGLSTFIWENHAAKVIGIEPNPDMIGKAKEKLRRRGEAASHIRFEQGFSNRLDLGSGTVDIVTCSQSFHWMEPVSTLKEVSRVLAERGVFAAYDCDWPPSIGWAAELAYHRLIEKADSIVNRLTEPDQRVNKWNKDLHLERMKDSQAFRFVKEIVFHNVERCDAERYVGLAISQGNLQTVFKLGSQELYADIEAFAELVEEHFGGRTLNILFSYRLRLGVK